MPFHALFYVDDIILFMCPHAQVLQLTKLIFDVF
jgi:hypothetical protein